MAANSIHRNSIRPALRIVLVGSLIVSGGMLIVSITWIYHKIHFSLGTALAEVSVTGMSILILVLIGVGMRAGLRLDQLIRNGNIEDFAIYQSFTPLKNVVSCLGYQTNEQEDIVCAQTDSQNAEDILALIEKPRKRGRSPTHPLDKWTRVVVAWENRDPIRHPMTLTEFLCEQFGENADGSPCMSENSFYANRKRVIAELRNNVAQKRFSDS